MNQPQQMDRHELALALMELGFAQIKIKEAAEAIGIPYHTLISALHGRRGCSQWITDRVLAYRDQENATQSLSGSTKGDQR